MEPSHQLPAGAPKELEQQEPKVCKQMVTNGFITQGFFLCGHLHKLGFQMRAWKSALPSQAVSITLCLLFSVLFCPWLAWLHCPGWHGRICIVILHPARLLCCCLSPAAGDVCAHPDPSIYCIYPSGSLRLG